MEEDEKNNHEENNKKNEEEHTKQKKKIRLEINFPKIRISRSKSILLTLAVLLTLSLVGNAFLYFGGGVNSISGNAAAQTAEEFIENYLLNGQSDIEITDIEETNGVYKFNLTLAPENTQFTSYITKDGRILFPSGYDISKVEQAETQTPQTETQQTQTNIPKSEIPKVELFVMSHCPYGTQAEKGIIPAVEALGDEIDFNIRFVYYAMHGEKEVKEQVRQYCIQKEQNDKFLPYLKCFLNSGEAEPCLAKADIDTEMLDSCINKINEEYDIDNVINDKSIWISGRFPPFNIYKDLNEKYKVGGSPTLVINGQQVQSSRSPAAYLATICSAFEDVPAECETELSTTTYSPGFGYTASDSTNEAQCA